MTEPAVASSDASNITIRIECASALRSPFGMFASCTVQSSGVHASMPVAAGVWTGVLVDHVAVVATGATSAQGSMSSTVLHRGLTAAKSLMRYFRFSGQKWWITGAGNSRCKIMILMGKTNPGIHYTQHDENYNDCHNHVPSTTAIIMCRPVTTATIMGR